MTAKEELSRIRKTDKLINRMLETSQVLRSSLVSVTAGLKQDIVQTSHKTDQMADTIAKVVDLEAEMNAYIDDLVNMKRDAFRVIRLIPDPELQNVLIARYLQFRTWDIIAEELNFSIQWVHKTHGKALQAYSCAKSLAS